MFFVDLHKAERDYSPTTMYRDYAINRELFHWESQSRQTPRQPTVQRYINHETAGHARPAVCPRTKDLRARNPALHVPGPVKLRRAPRRAPVAFTWRLRRRCRKSCSRPPAASPQPNAPASAGCGAGSSRARCGRGRSSGAGRAPTPRRSGPAPRRRPRRRPGRSAPSSTASRWVWLARLDADVLRACGRVEGADEEVGDVIDVHERPAVGAVADHAALAEEGRDQAGVIAVDQARKLISRPPRRVPRARCRRARRRSRAGTPARSSSATPSVSP